jgi:asparagine synthase (glutamine-hydrolysing)
LCVNNVSAIKYRLGMCGITGFISKRFNQEHLATATNRLKHRGPDGEGMFLDSDREWKLGLGHRRLAIIDLSAAADQPMTSHCGRYVMVFNGEIYNYKEIRAAKHQGTIWTSTGDTEVILESFAKYGNACFEWLNGMFTVAIWDKQLRKLTLARDHLGIKPLFFYYNKEEFLFASELKSITALHRDLTINYQVIPAYLHIGYIPHPHTIYHNVFKINAGSCMEISVGSTGQLHCKELSFWKIENKIETELLCDVRAAKRQLNDLLTNSIEKQLISDVPIGTFLSGGTDSSIVTAIASKVSLSKVNTYSIAVTDGKVNEAPFAEAVAKHLRTNHHELPISQKDVLEMIPGFLEVYDEPFSDSSAFPTMLVSKLARQHVTVALSGDGGDELFWGYGSYLWAKRLQNPLLKLMSPLISGASKFFNNRYQRAGKLFEKHNPVYFKSQLFSQDQYYFSENELVKILVNPILDFKSINQTYAGRNLSIQEEMSFWDIENYLKDDLLVKIDRASMQYSLETRVPILDYRIVEFALNLSPSLKINSAGVTKYILKQILYDYVPPSLLERPKWGFSIPMVKWLKSDLKWMIDKYCSRQMIEAGGILKYKEVDRLIQKYFGGADYLYKRIWAIIVLHWFLHERK